MGLASRQTGEGEFFTRTPEFKPLKGCRITKSNRQQLHPILTKVVFACKKPLAVMLLWAR